MTAAFLAPAFQETLVPFERRDLFAEATVLEVCRSEKGYQRGLAEGNRRGLGDSAVGRTVWVA